MFISEGIKLVDRDSRREMIRAARGGLCHGDIRHPNSAAAEKITLKFQGGRFVRCLFQQ